MNLLKKFAIATLMAAPLALTGCGTPATLLCPDNGPGLGTATVSRVFNDAATQKVCHLRGADLATNGRYAMEGEGTVVIDGNVPDGARVTVTSGKLFVNGAVGTDATLKANVPEDMESYTALLPVLMGKTFMVMPVQRTRFDDFTHKADNGAAVNIAGDIGAGSNVRTNHGLAVGGTIGRNVRIDHMRDTAHSTVQTGAAARTATQQALSM